jgi:hypothetical protein
MSGSQKHKGLYFSGCKETPGHPTKYRLIHPKRYMQETKVKGTRTKELISHALENAMGYREYADLVGTLAGEKRTSGFSQSEDYVHYTLLNHQRMRRWERKLTLEGRLRKRLEDLRTPYTWLVLTESWCGDAAPVLPAMNAMAEATPFLDLKIAFRDQNPELMDRFLTENARSIPKLLVISREKGLQVEATWGPRPEEARRMVVEYRERHGRLTAEFRESLQKWYNKDGGKSILTELTALLALE